MIYGVPGTLQSLSVRVWLARELKRCEGLATVCLACDSSWFKIILYHTSDMLAWLEKKSLESQAMSQPHGTDTQKCTKHLWSVWIHWVNCHLQANNWKYYSDMREYYTEMEHKKIT